MLQLYIEIVFSTANTEQIQTSASELEKAVAQKDEAVRQFEEEASAFTNKVEVLNKSLADKEKEYQVQMFILC
jgi:septal ring factor EnvC (AmiA/AmiB activator)